MHTGESASVITPFGTATIDSVTTSDSANDKGWLEIETYVVSGLMVALDGVATGRRGDSTAAYELVKNDEGKVIGQVRVDAK